MIKKTVFQLGRLLWHRTERYLPKKAKELILHHHKKRKSIINTMHIREDPEPGFEPDIFNSHIRKINPVPEVERDRLNQDGMRDYPVTRPNLAFDYLSGLVQWLAESDYTVTSYSDLAKSVKYGEENQEFQRWIRKAQSRNEKAILLQYDVDARADVTTALMKTHIKYGVPGNAMIFRKKIFDWKLKREGIIEYDSDYFLDFNTFNEFQKAGGVIGYHCNAFDRSGGNMDRAIEIFHEDVAELRKHLDINYFSMHGGNVTPDGGCNARIDISPYLDQLGMTWVHNGHSLFFHSNWADGSASNPRYRNESSDPLDFILSTNPGQRSRLLFHPQYYNDYINNKFNFPILQDQNWVKNTRDQVEKSKFIGKFYWKNRNEHARKSISSFDALFKAPENECPVFINGMSRSGTTLLVSMFDSHPDGAMAYESYPRYLIVPSDNGILTAEEYIFTYQTLMNYPDNVAFELLNRPPLKNLMRFAAVTNWTGMTTQQVGMLLRSYLTKYHRVTDTREALRIVAASARFKVRKQKAKFWGTKCQGNYNDYFELWPRANLVYILRNGLDILASQKNTGSFNPDAEALGSSWRVQLERFNKFSKDNPNYTTALVQYEHLVAEPEATMRTLCNDIGMDFSIQMIHQHKAQTTLTQNPRGQLSADRVQQPIDRKSVNKWKKLLSEEDVTRFLTGCGGTQIFKNYGLDWEL
ncbi:MAG: sulfotransferase [Gammaproteobacteria bacterium]|nr:sulfotransferase [Gammaproteobacteria bacterium]